jgi:hypothetical protein
VSIPAPRTTQPPIQWVPGVHSWGKSRSGYDANRSLPFSAEVKNEYELYSSPPQRLHGVYRTLYFNVKMSHSHDWGPKVICQCAWVSRHVSGGMDAKFHQFGNWREVITVVSFSDRPVGRRRYPLARRLGPSYSRTGCDGENNVYSCQELNTGRPDQSAATRSISVLFTARKEDATLHCLYAALPKHKILAQFIPTVSKEQARLQPLLLAVLSDWGQQTEIIGSAFNLPWTT